jgi:hypothetical protein
MRRCSMVSFTFRHASLKVTLINRHNITRESDANRVTLKPVRGDFKAYPFDLLTTGGP